MKTFFETKIRILHTNNGTEYFKGTLGSFFIGQQIHHQTTCVDIPQQNGIVECNNKHILELFQSIMFSMNAPKYFWEKVILIASYLINRVSTHVLDNVTQLDYFKKNIL